MANLTADLTKAPGNAAAIQEYPGAKRPRSFEITNALQLYVFGYVILSSGRLTQYDGATGSVILGYLSPTPAYGAPVPSFGTTLPKGNTSPPTGQPKPEASVETGAHVLTQVPVTGASAITDVNALVYLASDDNTVTKTQPNSSPPLGHITRWYSATICDVQVWDFETRRAFKQA